MFVNILQLTFSVISKLLCSSAVSKRLGAKPIDIAKVVGQQSDNQSSQTAMDVTNSNMPQNDGNVDKKNRGLALIAAELISFHP